MKGAIITNAYLSSEKVMYQPKRLVDEFNKLGVAVDILPNNQLYCMVGSSFSTTLESYDFIVYLDKDKYVLDLLSKLRVPCFNNYKAITTCDDKMSTCIALAQHGVPMPKTIAGLLCYSENCQLPSFVSEKLMSELNFPMVVKKSYGSFGSGVYLVNNASELNEKLKQLQLEPHLVQQFISNSCGRDVRAIVIGGKLIGAMLRSNDNDFRSNVALGGTTSPYNLDSKTVALAERVAQLLDLDYCGIDLLFGEDQMLVCEVNSNALFETFEKTTRINVAKIYAEYILSRMSSN